MKSKNALCGLTIAVVLQFGVLAGSAQTNKYLFSGSEMNITLPPGTYIITAYGAPGALPNLIYIAECSGGNGAEMSAEFNFSTSTTLTLLVGGGGYPYSPANNRAYAGGGGGESTAAATSSATGASAGISAVAVAGAAAGAATGKERRAGGGGRAQRGHRAAAGARPL